MLLVFAGSRAAQESRRRSERTKAGLERARAEGERLGRPPRIADLEEHRQWQRVLAAPDTRHMNATEAARKLFNARTGPEGQLPASAHEGLDQLSRRRRQIFA